MANILKLINPAGNVIVECTVDVHMTFDADQANADIITTALATQQDVILQLTGNSVPTCANTTLMYTDLKLYQITPSQLDPSTGTFTIDII